MAERQERITSAVALEFARLCDSGENVRIPRAALFTSSIRSGFPHQKSATSPHPELDVERHTKSG
ncbi:MAG: hypothetical protein JO011_15525 [Ktedonobacteraceae bacterium]|nr:hypothetical protein [Ktedonobacteraceae bacterium]